MFPCKFPRAQASSKHQKSIYQNSYERVTQTHCSNKLVGHPVFERERRTPCICLNRRKDVADGVVRQAVHRGGGGGPGRGERRARPRPQRRPLHRLRAFAGGAPGGAGQEPAPPQARNSLLGLTD